MREELMIVYLVPSRGRELLVQVLGDKFNCLVVSPKDTIKEPLDQYMNKQAWNVGNMLLDAALCDLVILDTDNTPEDICAALTPALQSVAVKSLHNFYVGSWFVMNKKYMTLDIEDFVCKILREIVGKTDR